MRNLFFNHLSSIVMIAYFSITSGSLKVTLACTAVFLILAIGYEVYISYKKPIHQVLAHRCRQFGHRWKPTARSSGHSEVICMRCGEAQGHFHRCDFCKKSHQVEGWAVSYWIDDKTDASMEEIQKRIRWFRDNPDPDTFAKQFKLPVKTEQTEQS